MGAPRRRNPIASRRRTDDDGDEDGSVVTGQEDELSSLGSGPSEVDVDADADGEASDGSDAIAMRRGGLKKRNGYAPAQPSNKTTAEQIPVPKASAPNLAMTDTEVMMNGLQISGEQTEGEVIHFDQSNAVGTTMTENTREESTKLESFAERRKREHEEYKKKRDEDPAFVPNRGGFFMHDQRTAATSQNGFKTVGRGRGRGRGGFGGPSSLNPPAVSLVSDAPWTHDLHETVADAEPFKSEAPKTSLALQSSQQQQLQQPPQQGQPLQQPQRPSVPALNTPPPNRSFSRSIQVGSVQLRVLMTGMKDPVVFSGVPIHQHTRLPQHRPPLRRDKPVRVSLPESPPRYIFPAIDRSFIFIPRAMRPNQQGFGRGRGRGSFSGYGGISSARNSIFGGSTYSPSVAMSRRSSIARELGRDAMASPAGSVMSRNRGLLMEVNKPVVRLPPSVEPLTLQPQPAHFAPSPVPVVNLPHVQAYPAPQKPATQNWTRALPMHQPRPQKQVSVAEIESPAALNFPLPQQQQQQPFHQQVPEALNGQGFVQDPTLVPHSRHPSHPSQKGTPLSQIPERAIHAQPFQPYPFQQQPSFYPQQYPTPVYYYASPAPALPGPTMAPPPVTASTFVPGQQYPFLVPAAPMSAPSTEPTSQPGTVAHETNGMVYYYDSSQLAAGAEDASSYQQLGFAPSTGYMVPQGTVFYPPQ